MKALIVGDAVQSKHKVSPEFVPFVGTIIAVSKDVGYVAVEWLDGRITKEALSGLEEHVSKLDQDFQKVAEKLAAAQELINDALAIAREHNNYNDLQTFLGGKLDESSYNVLRATLEDAGMLPSDDYNSGWQSSQKCW